MLDLSIKKYKTVHTYKSKSFNKTSKLLLSFIFCSKISHEVFSSIKQDSKNLYDNSDEKFNKLKKSHVYNPKTKQWERLQDLDVVKHEKSKIKSAEDKVLYKNTWVFDEKTKKWSKTDIKNVVYDELDDEDDEEEKTFGQKLSYGFTTGIGLANHEYQINGLGLANYLKHILLFIDGKKKHYYEIHGLFDNYSKKKVYASKSIKEIKKSDAEKENFSGSGFLVPINLFIDYTAFEKFRFGITFGVELNRLSELKPSEKIEKKIKAHSLVRPEGSPFFSYTFKGLVNLGWIYYQSESWDFLVLVKPGAFLDKSVALAKTESLNRVGFNIESGIGFEYLATGFITVIFQFMHDLKFFTDSVEVWKEKKASVKIKKNNFKFEVGLRFSFAENFVE